MGLRTALRRWLGIDEVADRVLREVLAVTTAQTEANVRIAGALERMLGGWDGQGPPEGRPGLDDATEAEWQALREGDEGR